MRIAVYNGFCWYNILALCSKRGRFIKSYDHEKVHQTSNMVDRLMKFFDRAYFNSQYFDGTFLC